MKILGVDLGSYSIKVAEMEASSKGYSLNDFLEYPLSQDPSRDRSLEVIEILRNLSQQYDPANTRWVIGISQHRVSAHHKRFPFRERLKILKSLPFELEDEIPLEIDETIYDAKIVEFLGSNSDVLAIACPKEAIEEAMGICKDGGFDPEILSVEGLALSNLYENWSEPPAEANPLFRSTETVAELGVNTPQPAQLVLHLGHSRSLLLVYRDHALISVRSILWGGADIAEAISKAFAVPIFEAYKILDTKSFILMNSAGAKQEQVLLSKTISGCLDILTRELRLTLLEVRAAFNVNFKSIDLMGGVSQIQNLGAYITQALEIPANIAHHLERVRQIRFQATAHVEASSAVAIGLAMEALKRPRNPAVNLRKGEFARENLAFTRFWNTWRLPVQVAVTGFFIFLAYTMVRDTLSEVLIETIDEKIVDVAKTQAGLKGSAARESTLRSYVNKQNAQLKMREEFLHLDKYVSALDILAKLSEKLPVTNPPTNGRGIDVSHLKIDNDEVEIEGRAQGAETIPQIEAALKELGTEKSLKPVQPMNPGQGPGTPFAYKFKVKRTL